MPIKTSISSKGGAKLKAVLDKAEQARRSKVKVGFMGGKYPDGTPDAVVAAANEYGLGGLPERPFFRQSVAIMQQDLPRVLPRFIDPSTLTVSHREGNMIGAWAADVIKAALPTCKSRRTARPPLRLRAATRRFRTPDTWAML